LHLLVGKTILFFDLKMCKHVCTGFRECGIHLVYDVRGLFVKKSRARFYANMLGEDEVLL